MIPLEAMRSAIRQIEEYSVTIDGEWGECRTLEELTADNALPPVVGYLRSAIAETERQEPVAWMVVPEFEAMAGEATSMIFSVMNVEPSVGGVPLYTYPPIQEGWQLVPVEPTEDMLDAAKRSGATGGDIDISNDYKAMLVAAPKHGFTDNHGRVV